MVSTAYQLLLKWVVFTVGSYDVDAHCLVYGALGLICYLMRFLKKD